MFKPIVTSTSFYHFLNKNRLMGLCCTQCGALFLPPRPICIRCLSSEMDWVQMNGSGKLITFTTSAVGASHMLEKGYDRTNHYCCGAAELDEGSRVSAHVVGVDVRDPDNIRIGTPVMLEFSKSMDTPAILTFRAKTEEVI